FSYLLEIWYWNGSNWTYASSRGPAQDADLASRYFERAANDTASPSVVVADAWWSQREDNDGDGCPSTARLNWNPDVVSGGTVQVRAKLYYRTNGVDWIYDTTTAPVLISGTTTNDSQSVLLGGLAGCLAFSHRIDLEYWNGSTWVSAASYGPAQDPDLVATTFESPVLDIPLDRFEPTNNVRATATALAPGGVYSRAVVTNVSLHWAGNAGDVDWYRFSLRQIGGSADYAAAYYEVANDDMHGWVVLALADANGTFLRFAWLDEYFGFASSSVSLAGLAPGTYYLAAYGLGQVYPGYAQVNPRYDLEVVAPLGTLQADRFESNNTSQTATDLGVIAGQRIEPELSLHSSSDADWFLFQTTTNTTSDHFVRIDFQHAQGNLGLALYNSYGLLRYSETASNREIVSLNGLPAGAYYVLVYGPHGSFNPDYTLTINTPGATSVPGDAFEPNDTAGAVASRQTGPTSPNLGVVEGFRTLSRLTIHHTNDVDWFRFEIRTAPSPGHFVSINSDYLRGDIDLWLCDSNGVAIPNRSSAGVRDTEWVSLSGLPPGVYFARVEPYGGALCPDYTLTFNLPGSDPYEPNNVRSSDPNGNGVRDPGEDSAYELGRLASLNTYSDLSIGANDVDWFKFSLAGTASANHFVRIDFAHRLGDLDLQLTDAAGNELRRSAGVADFEQISLQGLTQSNLHLRVYGYNNATNPAYTLTINAPPDERGDRFETNNTMLTATVVSNALSGYIGGSQVVRLGDPASPLSIHTATDVDWFRFTMSETGRVGHYVAIQLDHSLGDLDLELWQPGGATAFATNAGVANVHTISLAGFAPGDYLVKVFGYRNARNPAYLLEISAPMPNTSGGDAFEPNNSAATAAPLPVAGTSAVYENLSITAGDNDWFQFTLPVPGAVGHFARIDFRHSLGDLDLQLYDANGTNLLRRSDSVADLESIALNGLAAGTYKLRVFGYAGARNPSYTLSLSVPENLAGDWAEFVRAGVSNNNTAANAYDLREVRSLQTWRPLSLHTTSDVDWFRIATVGDAKAEHFALIAFDPRAGDLDLYVYDSTGTVELGRSATADGVEQVNFRELTDRGTNRTYLLKVARHNAGTSTPYSLWVNAPDLDLGDWAEPNNTQLAARDLHEVQGTAVWQNLSLHQAGDEDWFKFITVGTNVTGHEISIMFDHTLGDLNLQVIAPNGATLGSSNVTDRETVSLASLPRGTSNSPFYVRVLGANSNTHPSYSLIITAPKVPEPDWAETNNTVATATDLRVIDGALTLGNLSIHTNDVDWFQFTLDRPGRAGQFVRIDFNHAEGDLTLTLSNAAGIVRTSATSQNFEEVPLAGFGAGIWFVNVSGAAGATNPNYVLTVLGTPRLQPDFAEANDFPGEAFDLRAVETTTSEPSSRNSRRTLALLFAFAYASRNNSTFSVGNSYEQTVNYVSASYTPNYRSSYQQNTQPSNFDRAWLPSYGPVYQPGTTMTGIQVGGSRNVTGADLAEASDVGPLFSPAMQQAQQQYMAQEEYWRNRFSRGKQGLALATDDLFEFKGLSIHQPSDQDWFRLALPQTGAAGQFAAIAFDNELGDLQLELFEGFDVTNTPPASYANYLVERANTAGNSEEISLAGLAAGTYFLRVTGVGTNTNPQYSLALNVTPQPPDAGDFAEMNNSATTAYDLRTLTLPRTWDELSIHTTNDVDWFEFTTTATGRSNHVVHIDFDPAQGDLDLELWSTNGIRLGSSEGVGSFEEVSLAGRAPGTYLVRVFGYAGATNPRYSLTVLPPEDVIAPDRLEPNNSFATATDLSQSYGVSRVEGLTIHNGAAGAADDDLDYFKFVIPAGVVPTAADFVSIDFERGLSPLSVELYMQQGASWMKTDTAAGLTNSISLQGKNAGNYAAVVRGDTTDAANYYNLHLRLPAVNTANTSTLDEWTLMVYMTASDLERYAFTNVNEMELAATRLPASVNIAVLWDQSTQRTNTFATDGGLQSAWGETGRGIIRPDAREDVVATHFDLTAGEQDTGDPATLTSFIHWAAANAPAKRYALILWNHGGGILDGSNLDYYDNAGQSALYADELALALSNVPPAIRTNIQLIAFDACLMGMTEVAHALRDLARVFVASEESEAVGGFDYTTALAALEVQPENVTAERLASGLVQSFQHQYQGEARGYDTLAAVGLDRYAQNGLAAKLKTFSDATAGASADDWNKLREARSRATFFFGSPAYRDLGQFMSAVAHTVTNSAIRVAASNVVTALDASILAKSSDQRNTRGLSIYLPADGALPDYTARNGEFLQATAWGQFLARLAANGVESPIAPDWAEANDVAARGFDLHDLVGTNAFSGLNLHEIADADWYRFTLLNPPSPGQRIMATAGGATLQLELHRLVNGTRTQVLAPAGALSLTGLTSGDYLLLVRGDGTQTVTNYTLTIEAPGSTDSRADWAAGNNRSDKAYHLGTPYGEAVFSGLAANAGTEDWFTFETPRNQLVNAGLVFIESVEGRLLTAELFRRDGMSLIQVSTMGGSGALGLVYPPGPGVTYLLRVRVTGSGPSAAYTVRFQPNMATSELQPRITDSGRNAAGEFRFSLRGTAGLRYQLEFSTNLVNWSTANSVTNSSGIVNFRDPATLTVSQRFFRARLVP
ncbi:MAG: pre-peptidase C-terminal domain-containing protein, partial [Verrucomicrobia bacterium]|nr:pre-peptidase C-terminal domain-containing protein [Verrucomicrobiota bacterium]